VALVFVPHLKKTGAHGATRWIGRRAVVQLSVRFGWADIFWFTLFHEISHLLLHGRRGVFINFLKDQRDKYEREADAYAGDVLIPPALYAKFLARCGRYRFVPQSDVVEFAAGIGIHPGIVVGRLHHDNRLKPPILNELRQQYRLKEAGDDSPPG
jgi:HTH-type transcriptional regulator / antitoxin HigA